LIGLHCHPQPGVDGDAKSLEMSLAMARIAAADGISVIAFTPHNFPGIYKNTGPAIRTAVARLRHALVYAGNPVRLVTHYVLTRPRGIIGNAAVIELPSRPGAPSQAVLRAEASSAWRRIFRRVMRGV
jgi:protein-tyrosine phosphatase